MTVPTLDPVFQYMTGQLSPSQPPLLAAYEREGAEAVAALRPALDLSYGPHPRQRFDLFRAAPSRGLLAYLHAGYWQSRDKAQFRFVAPPFVAAGLSVAVVNYPLCPDVTLAELTEAVRGAVPALLAAADAPSVIVAGHSAGAHLAVELAMTDWAARGGGDAAPIAGVVGLSGVYDLQPLLATPLNERLRLDPASAAAASLLDRITSGLPPAVLAVGGAETAAFADQTARMAAAWAVGRQHRPCRGRPGSRPFQPVAGVHDGRGHAVPRHARPLLTSWRSRGQQAMGELLAVLNVRQ